MSAITQPVTSWRDWHIPISENQCTLRAALQSAKSVSAAQDEVPLIVKLVENPQFRIPGVTLFNGAVNLHDHDCIHILLGRGLLPKDEAFTIGFTMGSTHRVSSLESALYAFTAKNLYPDPYRFSEQDIEVYKDAVQLGNLSDCKPLNQIDYREFYDWRLGDIRRAIGLELPLLKAYYQIEQKRYAQSIESQRLLL